MSLIKIESDHRSFIDALLSAPRARGARTPEALFDRACDQAIERAEGNRRAADDDLRDGAIAGIAESDPEVRDSRPVVQNAGTPSVTDSTEKNVASPKFASPPPPKPVDSEAMVSKSVAVAPQSQVSMPAAETPNELPRPNGTQISNPSTTMIETPDLVTPDVSSIELPTPEARTLGDLAGRLPALEILARRHGEAVARLMAGAMQVESGLPGDDDLDAGPVDFARWRRDHTQARSTFDSAFGTSAMMSATKADERPENPLENVFPLRSMGARESVISGQAQKGAQPQPASASTMISQPVPHAATATLEPVSGASGVDVASRIEKFHTVVTRVANAIVRTADAGGGTAIVRLHPANLGRIQVEVSVESQVAAVQLAVENPQVRQAMAQDGWMLRESLAQQGLTLGEFSVRGDDAGAATFGQREAAQSGRSQRADRNARDENVQTASVPRRDLRAARISLTI